MVNQQGVANNLFKKYQDMAAEKGFDIFKPDDKQKSGLSAGIQGITENTADLLASYVNAIRSDVSLSRINWDRLLQESLPQMNVIAEAQLQQQRQIAENTLRTAEAAEAINDAMVLVTKNQERLERSWRRIAEKNWGVS